MFAKYNVQDSNPYDIFLEHLFGEYLIFSEGTPRRNKENPIESLCISNEKESAIK